MRYRKFVFGIMLLGVMTLSVVLMSPGSAQAATLSVNSTSDNVIAGDGNCTLREAIRNANTDIDTTGGDCPAGSGADTIELGAGLTYTLNSVDNLTDGANGLPSIVSNIAINGHNATMERGVGAPSFRYFHVASGGDLTLYDLTVAGGDLVTGGGGGAIRNFGVLSITNATFSNNTASSNGGAISSLGPVTITNSTFTNNMAEVSAGAITSSEIVIGSGTGPVTITNSTFTNNSSGIVGGAITNLSMLEIVGSTFSGNTSEFGGAIRNAAGTVEIINSTFNSNAAANLGGGVHNFAGMLTIESSTFSGNIAGEDGGGIYNSGPATVTDSTFSNNTADDDGGGIYNSGTLTITSSTISNNMAGVRGGGFRNTGTMTMVGTTVSDNTAGESGGGLRSKGVLDISDSSINDNLSPDSGGIHNTGEMRITDSTISGNTATMDSGGVRNNKNGELTVVNSTISGNSADIEGGGIRNKGELAISNSTISGNSAGVDGGGIRNQSEGTTTLENTIVANNTSGGDCSGTVASLGHNLDSDGSCNLSTVGDKSNNPNANLGLLQNNGGPTETQALQSGSDAIDMGDPAGCKDPDGVLLATDQRGVARPQGTFCDIGAYEFEHPARTAVGGTASFLAADSDSPAKTVATIAGSVAGAFALLFGSGWYARRRWLRKDL